MNGKEIRRIIRRWKLGYHVIAKRNRGKGMDTIGFSLFFENFFADAMLDHQLIQLSRADAGFFSGDSYPAFGM
jgi:hypothetical protein